MVRLTDQPHEASATPGFQNRHVRLRYARPADILNVYLAYNRQIGRTVCPACDYLKAHLDDDIMAVERHIYGHPDWGPGLLCNWIQGAAQYAQISGLEHGDLIARQLQHDAALALHWHPYERARGAVEAMLKHRDTRFVSPEAAYVCLAYLNAGHPNPRRFLEKPEVRAKFPPDLELHRFAAPDFDPDHPRGD